MIVIVCIKSIYLIKYNNIFKKNSLNSHWKDMIYYCFLKYTHQIIRSTKSGIVETSWIFSLKFFIFFERNVWKLKQHHLLRIWGKKIKLTQFLQNKQLNWQKLNLSWMIKVKVNELNWFLAQKLQEWLKKVKTQPDVEKK